jgi:splicing factor 3B subunit 2
MKEKKPGVLSAELIAALGILENAPPPWLINMQRYGPPPSYPNLRIPGLNAPLPEGASFGYHPGGWGKPPVDEYNRPLYGDVFGVYVKEDAELEMKINKVKWGVIDETNEDVISSSSESEDESEEETDHRRHEKGGMETPLSMAGYSSMTSGLETPDTIDLRKRAGLETPDSVAPPRELYQVIQERHANTSGQLFGSDKVYSFSKNDVQVSINPDQLEDQIRGLEKSDVVKDAYDNQMSASDRNDLDEDREKDPRRKRKSRVESGAVSKRHKDFKF